MFQCFNFDLVILWYMIYIWWYKRRNTGRQTRDKTVDPTRTQQQDVSGSAAQTMFSVPMFNVLSLQCSIYCHITKVCVYNVNFTSEHGPRLAKWWTLLSLDFKLKIENLWGAPLFTHLNCLHLSGPWVWSLVGVPWVPFGHLSGPWGPRIWWPTVPLIQTPPPSPLLSTNITCQLLQTPLWGQPEAQKPR